MALHHLLPAEKIRLTAAAADPAADPDSRTWALVKTDAFEAVQLVLRAGDEISPHAVPGHATIHCLEGRAILQTDKRIELTAGDWLYLDRGQRHSVSAIEDAALLVTILFG
ncbi:MAG TPA: cupin domain-containing protein [Sphingomicrobium sp.]|nr:cupin domain-containing protein [Sphingomicrobium sp.]